MAFNINDLRSNLNLGGARSTLFNVQLTFPTGVNSAAAGRKFEFTCEATELPASELGVIPVAYFGRIIKQAGDRTYDFRVVCDETNNTAEVIDTNGFAGDIYIKPARSINTIQLNFVAVRTGAEFSEIVGQI